jgi:hypothetical protein
MTKLQIIKIRKGGFVEFMKSKGKLGGQNKTPRLSNDRSLAEELVLLQIENPNSK